MFKVNRTEMDSWTKHKNSKTSSGKLQEKVNNSFKSTVWNIIDIVGGFTTYEMAHWINNIDRWLHNRTVINTITYKRGSILLIDLGASNFRFEPSFAHPCIVLVNRKDTLLVVPCSTKKYNTGYPDIINAIGGVDGFEKNTGVQAESMRWIHKNRVISKVGKTSSKILTEIDKHILNLVPEYKKQKVIYDNLENENKKLKDEKDKLENEINILKNELNVLKEKSR